MSYNYKIGYYSDEGSDCIELQHEKKFSDSELTEMIAEATIDTIKKMKQTRYYTHSFQDIFDDPRFVQYLIEKFGFNLIEYESYWSVFGWASIFDKSDWKESRDDLLNKITEAVNKAGFSRKDDDLIQARIQAISKHWQQR